jgi:homoserine O-acetyltransferase
MGTTVRIVLYAPDASAAGGSAAAAFSRIAELDDRLTDYRETSELMALCRTAGGPPVDVSPDLFDVLAAAQRLAARTVGAFDVTIGPLSHLWRRARATGDVPDAAALATAWRLVGYQKLHLSPDIGTVRLDEPGMILDLGGIAKGYAADEALAVLARRGAPRALVAVGGDIAAGDAPPGTGGWEVGVAPLGPRGARVPAVTLQRAGISTSGDAEQYLDAGGKHYSHIIDPITGSAASERRGVTVIAPNGMTADALATAVKLLGATRGLPIVEDTAGAAALVVDETTGGTRQYLSKRWPTPGGSAQPAAPARPAEADAVLRNFRFTSGETLPELRLHYRTYGAPARNAQGVVTNAVLVMHGTGGTGAQFVGRSFAGELFGAGQPLDSSRYFIILPDDIGHGQSSKPSDGLHARFPHYGYIDMVEAEHRLVTEGLGIDHLRLVMGTSMGGMHTWLWGERYPELMDALMPLASLPTQVAGRNRVWRRIVIDAIRQDPEWRNGEYRSQPRSLRTVAQMLWLVGSNPILRQHSAPTRADADRIIDEYVANYIKTGDANDILYAVEASRDYDPGPGLDKIKAPLVAINSADDLINPPELRILEHDITRVSNGRAIVLPLSDKTAGHGTHTLAALWKSYLEELLRATESR